MSDHSQIRSTPTLMPWAACWPRPSADFVCLATAHGEPFYLNPAGRELLGLGATASPPTSIEPPRSLRRGLVGGAARRGRAGRQQDRPLGRPQPAAQRADRRLRRRADEDVRV